MPIPNDNQLNAAKPGNGSDALDDYFQAHLETCESCRSTTSDALREPGAVSRRILSQSALVELLNEPAFQDAVTQIENLSIDETASPVSPATMVDAGFWIGSYRLLEPIGSGGMGQVYRAVHVDLKKVVAVKLLPPHRTGNTTAIDRFRREMQALGRFSDPHVVNATDAGEDNGRCYLVMEYVEGFDLSVLVDRLGPLRIADACELIRQAALGVQAIHRHGLIHRDIKPSNIMLSRTGGVKILDLGLSKFAAMQDDAGELTETGQILGTRRFMAPEQLETSQVDARADLYSLGASLWSLLSGSPPPLPVMAGTSKDTATVALSESQVSSPLSLQGDSPERLVEIIRQFTARNPSDRPGTAGELATALQPFCAGNDLKKLLFHATNADQEFAIGDDKQSRDCYSTTVEFAHAFRQWPNDNADGIAKPNPPPVPTENGARRIDRRWIAGIVAVFLTVATVLSAVFWPGDRETDSGEEKQHVAWNEEVRDCLTNVLPDGLERSPGRTLYTEMTIALDLNQDKQWALAAKASRDGKPYYFSTERGRFSYRTATPEEVERYQLSGKRLVRIGRGQTSTARKLPAPPVRIQSSNLRIEKRDGHFYLRGTLECLVPGAVPQDDLSLIARGQPLGGDPRLLMEHQQELESDRVTFQSLNVNIDLSKRQQFTIDPHKGVDLRLQAFFLQPKPSYYTVSNILPCRVVYDRQRFLAEWVIDSGGWVTTSENWNSIPKVKATEQLPSKAFRILAIGLEGSKQIDKWHIKCFEGLVELQSLFLVGSAVDDDALKNLGTTIPKLQWIDLSKTRVTDEGMKSLQAVQSLQRINLDNTAVTDVGVKDLTRLPNLNWPTR